MNVRHWVIAVASPVFPFALTVFAWSLRSPAVLPVAIAAAVIGLSALAATAASSVIGMKGLRSTPEPRVSLSVRFGILVVYGVIAASFPMLSLMRDHG